VRACGCGNGLQLSEEQCDRVDNSRDRRSDLFFLALVET